MGGDGPTFVIPGASKSGTSSLHYYLSEHPDVYMPGSKELHFFSRNENYERGLEAYERNFADRGDETAVGEASPTYFYHGKVWEDGDMEWAPEDDAAVRLQRAYPDVKIVISLRNPVERAYSQYWKNVRQGHERTFSFREALEAELDGERDHTQDPTCWVYANEYTTHLEHWLECFGRDQLLFVVFEDWITDTEATLRRICEFLGIEPLSDWSHVDEVKNPSRSPRSLRLNAFYHDYLKRTGVGEALFYLNLRRGYPPMDADTRRFARDVFEAEIRGTARLIDRELEPWTKPPEPEKA